jgi:hypothetical protein
MFTCVDPTLDRDGDAVPSTAPVDHIQPTAPEFDPNEIFPLKDFTFLLQCESYIDFFTATIRNRNTRQAYALACWQFFDWCAAHGLELTTV